jgi:hypothetical protein
MVEFAIVSRASDPKRPATGSGPFPSESQTRIAAVIDSNPLLCRPRVRAPQHAATNSVGGEEETFRRVHALLSRGSQTAPICSPVSSHAALAKCQKTEYVDRFGRRLWIPVQAQFARTLRRDLDAVKLSMTTPWSNGPIEGHINRLKAIKRQMYGRAGFELLKARVLPWDASSAA